MRSLPLAFSVAVVLAGACAKGNPAVDGGGGGDGDGGGTRADAAPGRPDATPGVEVCDGLDNDGDTFVDEGDDLCAGAPNATGRCNGMLGCVVESCEDGYFDIDTVFDNGCECAREASETNLNDCANAVDLGDFSDTNSGVELLGNLLPEGDVDWYRFRAVDTADAVCDNFHVRTLLLENPGGEYVVDVFRGGCGGEQVCDGGTDMQWYTNFSAGGAGECPCGPTSTNHCDDDTAEFVVSVRRKDGAAVTCGEYKLEVSNGRYPAP